jgi:hypothetical protein
MPLNYLNFSYFFIYWSLSNFILFFCHLFCYFSLLVSFIFVVVQFLFRTTEHYLLCIALFLLVLLHFHSFVIFLFCCNCIFGATALQFSRQCSCTFIVGHKNWMEPWKFPITDSLSPTSVISKDIDSAFF